MLAWPWLFNALIFLIVWGAAVVVLMLGLLYWWIRPFQIDPNIPGPCRNGLIGVTFSDTKELMDGAHFNWAHWPTLSILLSRQYNFQTWGGPTLNIGFGGAFFNIVSPRCLEYILRDNFDNYVKGKLSRSFKELLGETTFNSDGSKWKFHRKITVGLLNRQTVEQGALILCEKLHQLDRIIREEMNGKIFDFQKMAYSLIMDGFVKIGFGIDLNGLGNNKYLPFVEALDELNIHIHHRFNDLLWEIKQRYGIGKREKRVKELTQVIDNFADEIIEAVKQQHRSSSHDVNDDENDESTKNGSSGSGSNIVSRYIDSCRRQKSSSPTNRELRDIVISFIFAGRDTTSVAITWALYELTKNPTVVSKLREELRDIGKAQLLPYDLIQNMPYLHAVVLESLRLHPPAPESFRFSIKDDVLPDGTRIPAGSLVMFSINTINHSNKVWDDPETYRPERFLGHKEPSPFAFASFNAGPRTCPGKSLALMEIKLCLAFLLPRFTFENAKDHDGSYLWTTVMAMKGGFHVRATPI
ncbi:hypothetical protein ACA910_014239 [Epithemia clementina (nom. ined.)]